MRIRERASRWCSAKTSVMSQCGFRIFLPTSGCRVGAGLAKKNLGSSSVRVRFRVSFLLHSASSPRPGRDLAKPETSVEWKSSTYYKSHKQILQQDSPGHNTPNSAAHLPPALRKHAGTWRNSPSRPAPSPVSGSKVTLSRYSFAAATCARGGRGLPGGEAPHLPSGRPSKIERLRSPGCHSFCRCGCSSGF